MPYTLDLTLCSRGAHTLALFFGRLSSSSLHRPAFFDDPDESPSHVRNCVLRNAHSEPGACCKELHEINSVVVDAVLYVSAALRLLRGTGIRATDRYCAELFPALEGISVEIVVERAASIEEQGCGESATGSHPRCAFLHETAKGSEACVYSQYRERDRRCRDRNVVPVPVAIMMRGTSSSSAGKRKSSVHSSILTNTSSVADREER